MPPPPTCRKDCNDFFGGVIFVVIFFLIYGTIEVAYSHTHELVALFALDKINLQGMLLALGEYFP